MDVTSITFVVWFLTTIYMVGVFQWWAVAEYKLYKRTEPLPVGQNKEDTILVGAFWPLVAVSTVWAEY
jgi:hypothetical protein